MGLTPSANSIYLLKLRGLRKDALYFKDKGKELAPLAIQSLRSLTFKANEPIPIQLFILYHFVTNPVFDLANGNLAIGIVLTNN